MSAYSLRIARLQIGAQPRRAAGGGGPLLGRLLHWLRQRTKGSTTPALTPEEAAERKRVLERRYERLKRAERLDSDPSDS